LFCFSKIELNLKKKRNTYCHIYNNHEEKNFRKKKTRFAKFYSNNIFKVQFLPALYDPYATGDYTTFDSIGLNTILESYLVLLLTMLFIIVILLRPTYKSTQFKKMNILCWILLGMAIIEVLGHLVNSPSLDNMIQPGYNLIFTIFMIPIFLSIMTHVNLNKNLGFWIGLLYGVNSITPIFFSLPINNNIIKYAPYVAFVMLILFMISFRENRNLSYFGGR